MPRKREILPEDYNEALPIRLRYIMKKQNKTQQDVADAIGKTRQSIGYYADGTSSPDWKVVAALAEYFDVSADWLLGLTIEEKRPEGISEQIGLSDNAIYALEKLSREDRYVLSFLLEQEDPHKDPLKRDSSTFFPNPDKGISLPFHLIRRISKYFNADISSENRLLVSESGVMMRDCDVPESMRDQYMSVKEGDLLSEAILSDIRAMIVYLRAHYIDWRSSPLCPYIPEQTGNE